MNTKFLAIPYPGGGGPVAVFRLDQPGRIGSKVPLLTVHKSAVLDAAFHPFNEHFIATAGDDAVLKLSEIPAEGIGENAVTEAVATFEGHNKKVNEVGFNPVAENVMSSISGDNSVRVWDVSTHSEVYTQEIETPLHHEWNRNGSLLAVTSTDKHFYLFDPRDSKSAAKVENKNARPKKNAVVFADKVGLLVGILHTDRARTYRVWDPKKLDAPLASADIDQAAGVLIPYFDNDTGVLFLAGKGDSGIKYFEVTSEAPYIHALSSFSDNQSTVGVSFLPKRACDVKICEIARAYRLLGDSCVPISLQVPRKSDLFQKDLYPETYAGIASLTFDEWKSGKNADPKLVSLDPKHKGGAAAESHASSVSVKKSYAELESEVEALKKRVAELEAQLAAKS